LTHILLTLYLHANMPSAWGYQKISGDRRWRYRRIESVQPTEWADSISDILAVLLKSVGHVIHYVTFAIEYLGLDW